MLTNQRSTTSTGRALTVAGVLALCVSLLAGWLTVLTATAAPATATPAVTVSQTEGLVNQRVLVKWTGFTVAAGTSSVIVMQCKGANPAPRDCWGVRWREGNVVVIPSLQQGTAETMQTGLPTAADGSGQAWISIRPSLRLPTLGCSDQQACSVMVFVLGDSNSTIDHFKPVTTQVGTGLGPTDLDLKLSKDVGYAVATPLHFAPAADSCPGMEHPELSVNGTGEFNQAGASWVVGMCTAKTRLVNATVSSGSGPSGRETFLSGGSDIGITQQPIGGPLDAARPVPLPAVRDKNKTVYAPVTNGALVVAFNVDEIGTRLPITEMKLTPRLVAKLITGAYAIDSTGVGSILSIWADPEFIALNGNKLPNTGIDRTPILRGVQDDTIWALTAWLAADPATAEWLSGKPDENKIVCPAEWRTNVVNYPFAVYTNQVPRLADINVPQSVYEDIATRLGNSQSTNRFPEPGVGMKEGGPDGYGSHNVMTITTLEAATRMGTPVAKIRNAAGNFADPTDPATIRAGLAAAKPGPDGVTLTNDYKSTSPNAYPLTVTDVAMASTDKLTAERADKIDTFLQYAAEPGQAQVGGRHTVGGLPPGYIPLSDAQKQQIAAARKAIADAPKWTGELPKTEDPKTDSGKETTSNSGNGAGSNRTGGVSIDAGGTGNGAGTGNGGGNNGGGNNGGGGTTPDTTPAPTVAPLASTPSAAASTPATAPIGAASPPTDKGPFPSVANVVKNALKGDPSSILMLVLILVSGGAALACPVLLSLGHKRRTGLWPKPVASAIWFVTRLVHRPGAAA
ncbi:hypothetical protein [Streptomyces sp. SID3343]|uniref:hypothetical protein n=1 Tax=Streptomyces sp. SID3343 TaxID=2690260 RepID=UPI00136AC4D4|nr:hypothetical protein [Streptomyces sp. SID3343]MYV98805.1 hypothetical protein [Streptomyces sp. SID3343]